MSGWREARSGAPERLGPYRVLETLGRGGTGTVYRAITDDGAAVALKTIRRSTHDALASMRAEVHALRRVQHAGVVRVLGDGIDRGRPWFAMELLEGQTLAALVQPVAPDPGWSPGALRPLLELVARICEPLAALHDCGLVHRDLKPDNIFIRPDGQPVIVDLGLARGQLHADSRAVVDTAPVAGTFAYMAPEQLAGDLGDGRTDLYALGCILFELLVGAPPAGEHELSPGARVAGIPDEIDALVQSLLQPRPRDRIGHAEDVRRWLNRHLEPSREPLSPSTSVTAPRRLYRPRLAGRRDVLRALTDALEAARTGRGAIALVEGESGIGKSHLASELGRFAIESCTVIPAANQPRDGVAQPPLACWGALFELAVDRALVAPEAPVAAIIARDRPLLLGLHRAFERLPDATSPVGRHINPTAEEVTLAVRDLIGALAEERPVVILLDDLHWADELTLGVVKAIAGAWVRRRNVLIVATVRTDDPNGAPIVEARRFALGALATPELRELVADMLGVGEPPAEIVGWIAQPAEGNPFLAAEYLRLVISELPIERELALPTVRIKPPSRDSLEQLRPPSTVRELVMRRLSRLDPVAIALAELIAVLGGTLVPEVVGALEASRRDALFELQRAQVLEPTSDGGQRLAHDRVRVVLHDQIPEPRARALHAEAAALLDTACVADPPHGAIAHHHLHAGARDAALVHLERAGEVALARAAYELAARHYTDLRHVADELAAAGATFEAGRRARWSLGAARASYCLGDSARCEDRVREALALVERRLPKSRLGWATLVTREAVASQLPVQIPGLRPGRRDELHAMLGDVALATSLLPYRYFLAEDLVPLVATALLSANLARRARLEHGVAGPQSLLAAMAGLFRLTGVARRNFEAAEAAAVAIGDWREAAQVYALESMYQGSFGRMREAEQAAARALAHCARTTDPWVRENVETSYAHVEYYTGRFEAARRRAEWIARSARERGNAQHERWGLYLQARSDIEVGRWDSAERMLREVLRGLATTPELISEVVTRGMMARVSHATGQHDEALLHARWVTARVRRQLPPAYPSLIGYTAAAHVWRARVADAPSAAHWRGATDIAVSLWRFAALFPMALPAALLHTAELFRFANLARVADRLAIAGARIAEESGTARALVIT